MRGSVRIRDAHACDAARLREIAVAAKGHWGYDARLVEDWAATELQAQRLARKEVLVAEVDGRAVGWASLVRHGDVCLLDDLWVDPDRMGAGIGTVLFRAALARARVHGAVRVEWEAEPNALGFYGKVGGRYLRDGEPTAFGRVLAVMGIDV